MFPYIFLKKINNFVTITLQSCSAHEACPLYAQHVLTVIWKGQGYKHTAISGRSMKPVPCSLGVSALFTSLLCHTCRLIFAFRDYSSYQLSGFADFLLFSLFFTMSAQSNALASFLFS